MTGLFSVLVFAISIAGSILQTATAAQEATAKSAVKRPPTYFPNTEELRADEMRVTALGTGLPTPITRAQKSTAWMVELGNGAFCPQMTQITQLRTRIFVMLFASISVIFGEIY